MASTRKSRWLLVAILALAMGLRLGAAVWWQSRVPAGKQFGFPDSESYWELGQKIAAGKPYSFGWQQYRVFRTPGYPLLLSPLFLIGGQDVSVMAARVLSCVLGTITVALTALLARRLFGERVALLSALAVAIYPEAIAQSVFVLSEAPFTPLMVLNLLAWVAAYQAETTKLAIRWAMVAGIAAGLATLMRPSWLLFVPFALGIATMLRHDRQRYMVTGLTMLAALCVTMTPWWIYTYSVAGRFIPTSLQVGASLYDGLNPMATGASDMRFVTRFELEERQNDLMPRLRRDSEVRLDDRMKQESLAWARANPRRVAELAGIKFLRIWNPWPNAAEFNSTKLRLVLMLSYVPAMILAGLGLWRSYRLGWPIWLLVLPAIYFTALHMIFVSSIRYRQPAMVPLLILSAVAVNWLLTRNTKHETRNTRH
jgi:4-amino-4-deoxy-L-arabinose transferase-like glycosyltransferase